MRPRRPIAILTLGLTAAGAATSARAAVIYVRAGAAGNGSSWATALPNPQAALAVAVAGDEIWVAEGTYRPAPPPTSQGQERNVSFAMRTGVSLYGGFTGSESTRDQRDWAAHRTILSGDLQNNDGPDWSNRTDNSYHVVTATTVQACTLDGFTVSGGYADGEALGANPASQDQGSGANVYYASPHFENILFEGNWASNHGAVNDHGDSTLAHCTFRNNFAQVLGAGLYMHTNSDTRAITCTFTGNVTPQDGGGAYSRSIVGGVVQDSTFTQNTANNGAGMYNSDDSVSAIAACIFASNVALNGGGGIYAHFAHTTVVNCTFSFNHAGENIDSGGGGSGGSGGGGFWASGGSPTITGCSFNDNVASFGGGAYFNENSAGMVTSCTFTHNYAHEAGGLYNLSSPVTVRLCTFTDNTATGGTFAVGGGFSSYFSDSFIDSCSFFGNHAFLGGGGLYCEGSNPVILNSVFVGNDTTGHEQGWGGAILNGYFTNALEANCTFVGNTADSGGAIANAVFANPLITSSTFSGNTSLLPGFAGGAIHSFDPSTPTIANVIAWNDSPAEFSGIVSGLQYSCVKDGAPAQSGPGNINADPRLTRLPSPGPDGLWGTPDDDAGDLRLRPGSPCIDAGENGQLPSTLTTDQAGLQRYSNDPSIADSGLGTSPLIDMGALEFQGASCSSDYNGDSDAGTDADIEAFFACLGGSCCPTCQSADFNQDGDSGTDADIESFFRVLAGGPC